MTGGGISNDSPNDKNILKISIKYIHFLYEGIERIDVHNINATIISYHTTNQRRRELEFHTPDTAARRSMMCILLVDI